ncbi:MAG TPA: type IV toxin-antitoxin system AbiEi family antitoxin domain-containing protein [Nocardioides sp.]|nr:type IV toxin-antitoxin system AbiEi family antitoxin domain-containing protein [Nocardioides sp.]
MDPLRVLTSAVGYFTRLQALAAGLTDRDLTRLVRHGALTRFRRGAYAFTDEWSALDAVGQHNVRANAVMHSLGSAVALSHVSAVARHGLDIWRLPLAKVHVTRLDGAPGRVEGDVVHHEGKVDDADLVVVDGVTTVRAERAVLEAGSRVTNEAALALFDAGLRADAFDRASLERAFERMEQWPFMRHLHIPVRMADGRSGSIGESRGMWAFFALHLPAPIQQFEVRDASGQLLGISDWGWPEHRLLGEFDGLVKYGRLLKPGQTAGDAVFQEKRREDLLREATQYAMLRLIWADYDHRPSIWDRFWRLSRLAG